MAEPGHVVALVGPSGAGKTTLTSLIPRLYDVTSGAVRIDGRDIRDVTLQSLADAIGVVSQDPHLFHDTVAANLRYARPDATDAQVVQACQAARIHDVIATLPDGYETMVGSADTGCQAARSSASPSPGCSSSSRPSSCWTRRPRTSTPRTRFTSRTRSPPLWLAGPRS